MPKILLLAEHADGALKAATAAAAGFAAKICAAAGGEFEILVAGSGLAGVATAASRLGAARVLVADDPALAEPLADRHAHVVVAAAKARGADWLVAASSTYGKDVLPRAAALVDAGMVSDVTGFEMTGDGIVFRRPMFAGNVIATVRLDSPVKAVSVRATAFPPHSAAEASPVEAFSLAADSIPGLSVFVRREVKIGARPDPVEARIVVSGGRALKNPEDFERVVGGLADALGGAVGSSRALVDAGITPNSLQIGQTGKIVAPELYLAVGISGAIQHLAGIKDAKIIAAINKDADAPIFEIADYGLVADVYTAVPELIALLRR
jgi:electron transfer flavoprotein alpha subunit